MTHFTAVELCYVAVYTCLPRDATMISRALNDSSFQSIKFVRNTMPKGILTNDAACDIVDRDFELCFHEGIMAWVLFDVSTCALAFQNACLSRFPAFKQVFMSLMSRSLPRPIVVLRPPSDNGCQPEQ